MLQRLRDYFPKWLIASLLGLLCLLMIIGALYNPVYQQSHGLRRVLATVNKKKIRLLQLEEVYQSLKQQHTQEGVSNLSPEEEKQARLTVFQHLINAEVLKQSAYIKGYRVHPQDILSMVKSIPDLQVEGQFSKERFSALLKQIGQSQSSFLQQFSENHITRQPIDAISNTAFILPKEIRQAVRFMNQTRDFSYVELPIQQFMPPSTSFSEDELKAYYNQHLTDYRVPECVDVEYLIVPMNQPKTVTHKKDEMSPSSSVSKEQLQQLLKKHPKSLVDIANSLHLSVQSTGLFHRADASAGITKQAAVLSNAFDASADQKGRNQCIVLDEQNMLVFRVREYQPMRLASFEEKTALIREHLALAKAKETAKAHSETIIAKFNNDPHAFPAELHNYQWRKIEKATHQDTTIPVEILQAVFSIPSEAKIPYFTAIELSNGSQVIIQLTKIRPGQLSTLTEKQRDNYRKSLLLEAKKLDNLQYIQANQGRVSINLINN